MPTGRRVCTQTRGTTASRSASGRARRAVDILLAIILFGSAFSGSALFGTARLATAQHDTAQLDSTRDAPSPGLTTRFRVYPSPLWSTTSGFAAGAGYEIRHAVLPYDRFLVTAKPGQHLGRYTATYFAGDPAVQPLYGLVNAYYETTGRQWFYGVGPFTSVENRIAVEKTRTDVEVRAGLQLFDRRLFIQPTGAYHHHRVQSFSNWNDGAYERLDASSRRLLDAAVDEGPGTSFGVAAGIDLRGGPIYRRTGVLLQASGRRYTFQEPAGLEFDRFDVGAYLFLPIFRNSLELRAIARLTNPGPGVTIPFYLLPSLDGRLLPGYAWDRFFGTDLLVLTLDYAVPLIQFVDVAALDALVSFGAGNVYDDLAEQFTAAISFEKRPAETAAVPMRPSASLGFDLRTFTPITWSARVLLGWSPEGVRLIRFGFVHDMQAVELNKR